MLASVETLQLVIYAGLGFILLLGIILLIKQLANSPAKNPQESNPEATQPAEHPSPPPTSQATPSWQKKDSLFSASEARFLLSLQQAVTENQLIVAKVPLSQLLEAEVPPTEVPNIKSPQPESPHNPSKLKTPNQVLDFLLLNASDFGPQLAIQLQPPQPSPEHLAQQSQLSQLCAQAQLPLLHIPSQNQHIPHALAEQIRAKLASPLDQSPHPSPE